MKNRLRSLIFAIRGIRTVFVRERNFQIQVLAAILVGILMFVFPLTLIEQIVLVLVICLVLLLELVNSAVEYTLDILHPSLHPTIAIVKDVMAGTVLVGSVTSIVIGLLIFFPHLWPLVSYWW